MSNKSVGNRFEADFCDKLGAAGFWAHNMAMSQAGQPADVIAVRNGRAYLIDCKDCQGDYFAKSRIEENQRRSMELWSDCLNGSGWFAVRMNQRIFMVEIWRMDMSDKKNLDFCWFMQNAVQLKQWVEEM